MAITQYATFTLADGLYGVEVQRVQEVLRAQQSTPVPAASPAIGGLINLRGQVVTAIDLRTVLDLPPRPEDTEPMNVVVRVSGEAVSFLVDVIGGVVERERRVVRTTAGHPRRQAARVPARRLQARRPAADGAGRRPGRRSRMTPAPPTRPANLWKATSS